MPEIAQPPMQSPPKDRALGPWKGWYPGITVSNDDPLKLGRIRVRVGVVYGTQAEDEYIPDEQLPWALPCFPAAAKGSGHAWVPPVGSEVHTLFWGGDSQTPMWTGGYYTEGEPPPEFISSYEGGTPKTRVIRLENGHVFEMRWKGGEVETRIETAAGCKFRLIDDPALGGTKIEGETPGKFKFALDDVNLKALMETPGLREVVLDDKIQQARVKTPTQSIILDDTVPAINVTTPGNVNVQAGKAASVTAGTTIAAQAGTSASVTALGGIASLIGQGVAVQSTGGAPSNMTGGGVSILNYVGASVWNFVGLSITCAAALLLTSLGLMTITGLGVVIVTTGAAITIGSAAGAKQAVVLASFLAKYDGHGHPETGGTTGPPNVLSAPTDLSTKVVVDSMALLTGIDRRDEKGRTILGKYTGAAYPFGPDESGTLGPKSDLLVVFTSMANILSTPKGSVPYDPNLGSIVPLLLFEPLDEITMGLIRYFTFKDLDEQEPRALVHAVFTERDGDFSVRVAPSFSLVGDPLGAVHNAPLTFRREAAF